MPVGVSAYVPLATKTLTGTAASVTFSSISQAYRDLILVVAPKSSPDALVLTMQFNGDTNSNYSFTYMMGNGVGASAYTGTNFAMRLNAAASVQTAGGLSVNYSIMDYSTTNKHKSVLARSDLASAGTEAWAYRWASTAAITSIDFAVTSGSFTAGSTFTLYGVTA